MRVALLLVLGAPGVLAHAETTDSLLSNLAAAKARWEQAGLINYRLKIFDGCFCVLPPYVGPVTVVVRNAKVHNVTYATRAWENFYPPGRRLLDGLLPTTIPDWFRFIEQRIRSQPPEHFSIEYDLVDGHPQHFHEDDPAIRFVEMDVRIEKFERR